MSDNKITKEEIARGYDELADHMADGGLAYSFYNKVATFSRPYRGHILDVGCGSGILLQRAGRLADAGTKFYGLDISPKLCDLTRANNPEAEVSCGDAEDMSYDDNKFDMVLMTEALEHMLDYNKSLSEVRRVLKPGGKFIVTVPNRDWLRYDFYDKIRNKELQPVDDHYFRFEEIKSYLENNSFGIEKIRGLDNLYYYGWKHNIEEAAAFFLPFLHKKMKRLLFRCINQK
ncbi:MAG: class I SAM-dependent methyltransferase [bacterium]|nr:class I SAM-dependent methyltransferase [bacterium]